MNKNKNEIPLSNKNIIVDDCRKSVYLIHLSGWKYTNIMNEQAQRRQRMASFRLSHYSGSMDNSINAYVFDVYIRCVPGVDTHNLHYADYFINRLQFILKRPMIGQDVTTH